jgi:hypothetical protein
MASAPKVPPNPMDDLAPRGNLPSKEDLKPPARKPPPKKPPPKKPPPKKPRPKSKDDMDDLTPYQNLPSPEDLRPPEPSKRYAKGGSVRGGGCEMRGKTRGKFI